jgi:hypothetical protein
MFTHPTVKVNLASLMMLDKALKAQTNGNPTGGLETVKTILSLDRVLKLSVTSTAENDRQS